MGSWSGTGDGNSGTSTLERSYEFILNDQFLLVRNKAVFPPQTKNPKGEIHEDLGVISYDKRPKTFILREFYSEGYVNQFVLKEQSADGKKLVFTTEAVENGPPMMRARTTWEITGERSLNETFELAFDGKTFKPLCHLHAETLPLSLCVWWISVATEAAGAIPARRDSRTSARWNPFPHVRSRRRRVDSMHSITGRLNADTNPPRLVPRRDSRHSTR